MPRIDKLTEIEQQILSKYQFEGYAVADIKKHPNLWKLLSETGQAVYVGRQAKWGVPKKWGNPYEMNTFRFDDEGKRVSVEKDGTRREVLINHFTYRQSSQPDTSELANKVLFCHCYKTDGKSLEHCHATTLAGLANNLISFEQLNSTTPEM